MALSLVKNTLLSPPYLERVIGLGTENGDRAALLDIVSKFEQMKSFASEIHTELHLVKPIFKVLGYTFESKPKFFEDHVKGADFALFRSEDDRIKSSPHWGTRSYYENVMALSLVKRYGRNLEEGISGFFLEFESRLPLYQLMYLTKKSGAPWGIMTNGKNWLLLAKPFSFEKRLLEIDLEKAAADNDDASLALFCNVFSAKGLDSLLPGVLEEERAQVIKLLQDKKSSLSHSMPDSATKTEAYSIALRLYNQLFAEETLSLTQEHQRRTGIKSGNAGRTKPQPVKTYDQSDIFTYLMTRNGSHASPDFHNVITGSITDEPTKENLLALRILDMTPGFGDVTTQLVEALAYLSFLLPYQEKRSFVAEWENEKLLHKYILDRVLYGIERYHPSLDVLQNGLVSRFRTGGTNFRMGNPLFGISTHDLQGFVDEKNQRGLFSRHPREVIAEVREMYRLYFSLSDRIKEDAAEKNELALKLRVYRRRMSEAMDLVTASYFDNSLENRKIRELLYYLDGDEAVWKAARTAEWFVAAKEIAIRNYFFHMEIAFPFLLNDKFDLIVIQPALHYVWEEATPMMATAKAYIKRAMTYLRETGKVVLVGGDGEELVSELKKSRRYAVEARDGVVVVRRR